MAPLRVRLLKLYQVRVYGREDFIYTGWCDTEKHFFY